MLCTYFVCISAGVMYWGDAGVIDTARIDRTGRRISLLVDQTAAEYSAFLLYDGDIYITDLASP